MNRYKTISIILFVIWLFLGLPSIIIGIGFAGGLGGLFVLPTDSDAASFFSWIMAWLVILGPLAGAVFFWRRGLKLP
jgi:hypothetical protein